MLACIEQCAFKFEKSLKIIETKCYLRLFEVITLHCLLAFQLENSKRLQAKRLSLINDRDRHELALQESFTILKIIVNQYFKAACESLRVNQPDLLRSHHAAMV